MSESTMEVGGVVLTLDEDGFLQEPDLRTEEVAQAFAEPRASTASSPTNTGT